MAVLSNAEVQSHLTTLADWKIVSGELAKNFQFSNFLAAMRFVNEVATLAEEANHHPDIDIRYNRVRLTLITHSEGGLTERDFLLAGRIQEIS